MCGKQFPAAPWVQVPLLSWVAPTDEALMPGGGLGMRRYEGKKGVVAAAAAAAASKSAICPEYVRMRSMQRKPRETQ